MGHTGNSADDGQSASGVDGESIAKIPRGLVVGALVLLVLVLLTQILLELGPILKPLFIAVLLWYLLLPAHRWLVARRIPSWLSYALIAAVVMIAMYALGNLIYASAEELARRAPAYQAKIDEAVDWARTHLPLKAAELERLEQLVDEQLSVSALVGAARAAIGPFIGFLTMMFIVVIYLVFLVAEADTFQGRLRRAYGEARARRALEVTESINRAIGRYLAVKTSVSFVVGLLTTAILWVFGVDLALLWGVLAFLLNFIPYLGSFVAVCMPILVSFVQFDSVWTVLVLAVLLIGVQQTMAYLVEPRLAGHRLNLSPLIILLALAFWGWLWGIVGLFLAIPLVVVVKIVLDANERTRPVATLMANVVAEPGAASGPPPPQ
jgi:AI-2 transport protein TqsA